METQCKRKKSKLKQVVLGILIIAVGIFLIGKNMGVIDEKIQDIIMNWPTILILLGFYNLFERGSFFFALLLLGVGAFFMAPFVFNVPINFVENFWPILIVFGGIIVIATAFWKKSQKHNFVQENGNENFIDDVIVFGGADKIYTSEQFKGGKSVNIFGGSAYNLSNSTLSEGTHILEVVCVFGGTKIIVPSDWNLKVEIVSILGGFEDKRLFSKEGISTNKTLIIKGVAIFGGGEITSK